jgi:probable HAF family extracellular repeat protein
MNCNSTATCFRRRFGLRLSVALIVLGYACSEAAPAGAGLIAISGTGGAYGINPATFSVSSTSAYSVERDFSVNNFGLMPPVPDDKFGSADGMAYADLGGVLKLYEAGTGTGSTLAGAYFKIRGHFSGPASSLAPYGFSGTGWAVPMALDVGGTRSVAYGVNDTGQVVGISTDAAGAQSAFLWQNGRMQNLNSLVDTGKRKAHLLYAYKINEAGYIVGLVSIPRPVDGLHGFLLMPKKP